MARPRTVTDEAILDAAMALMYREGPNALTFAAVGRMVGLSPATLVQRYPTKAAFLQAAMLRGWDQIDETTAALDQSAAVSPDGAVAMLVAMIPPGMTDAENAMGLAIPARGHARPRVAGAWCCVAQGPCRGARTAAIAGSR